MLLVTILLIVAMYLIVDGDDNYPPSGGATK
ncbi:hypothetical protein [Klebsiella phage 175002]|uniref:Uncharacterized protein n=1 Tax=Klebsiella phage vB_KpnP_cmc355D TaxID=3110534 RepID=A0ABZ1A049_9CAUD|nr:hypothetical protein A3a_00021 [Klebsiella phage VLCpiA3a]WQZ00602.1 hypothetical protein [Klebsiella phage vB_KpnP_cmc355D]